MSYHRSARQIYSVSVILGFLLIAAPPTSGQSPQMIQSFTATTANMATGNGESVRINVFAWTSAADREKFVAAFKEKGEPRLLEALKGSPSAGYVWTSETLGYTLRYAHRIALPDGGERIILLTDRPLGSWSRTPLKAAGADGQPSALTALELRLSRTGRGEGKMMSSAAAITVDEEAQTLALANYEKAPVLLKELVRLPEARTR